MEACWFVWVGLCMCAGLPLLYFLWKHHPSYGANPGGPVLPLVGCLPFILLNKHRYYEWTCELFDRSPSLTRRVTIGRTIFLSTADPQVVHHILKSHFASYIKGPSFYPFFADLLGSGIFNCDGPLWRFQRKVASHEFTSNSLKDFVIAVADAEIRNRLLPALDSACLLPGSSVDLQALLMHYTFDTICQLTFGADPACLDTSKGIKADAQGNNSMMGIAKGVTMHAIHDDGHALNGTHHTMPNDVTVPTSNMKVPDYLIKDFVQGFQTALQIVAERFLVPRFIWETKRSLKIGSEKKLLDALEAVNKFTSFVIEQSKRELGGGKERKDLLARFMRLSRPQVDGLLEGQDEAVWKANSDEHGQVLSDSLLKGILLSFILAGRETVASGATFLMWLLSVHPRVEKAILEEIKGILKDRESNQAHSTEFIGTTEVGTFSYDELRKMNYLQAALSESMRLYPPVPSDCKYAMEDDTFPDGTQVLKGYQISYNVFAMGRAERVWGKDCLEFRPERWLGDDGQFVAASPYKYPVFQAGPRICLGKDFAFIQMKLLVASLVRDFEFVVQPGFKPKLSYGVTMLMVNGLPVTLKRRQESLW
eukprot:c24734_g1_i2 orf=84-1865(-)